MKKRECKEREGNTIISERSEISLEIESLPEKETNPDEVMREILDSCSDLIKGES